MPILLKLKDVIYFLAVRAIHREALSIFVQSPDRTKSVTCQTELAMQQDRQYR